MAERLRAVDRDVELEAWPRVFHVWPMFARILPEARAAIARIGAFLGSITIDGKTYDHDVFIRLSSKVEKRRKKLSKEKYGTSHLVYPDSLRIRENFLAFCG